MLNCFNLSSKLRIISQRCDCSYHNNHIVKEQIIEKGITSNHTSNCKKFTQGPLDGSLYATVDKKIFSEFNNLDDNFNTTSIDSGICSSLGEQQNNHDHFLTNKSKNFSHFNNKIKNNQQVNYMQKSNQDTELDDLVNEILLDLESIPDFSNKKSNFKTSINQDFTDFNSNEIKNICGVGRSPDFEINQPISTFFIKKPINDYFDNQNNIISKVNQNIPNSLLGQPFSYGVPTTSPAIQRRRLQLEKTAYISESKSNSNSLVGNDENEEKLIELLRKEALQDNYNNQYNRDCNYSFLSDGAIINNNEDLNWLQKQKLKLKNRKEGELIQNKVNKEKNLLAELRGVVGSRADSNKISKIISQTNFEPFHTDTLNNYELKSKIKINDNNNKNDLLTIHTKKKTLQKIGNQKNEENQINLNSEPVNEKATTNIEIAKQNSELIRSNSPLYGSIKTTKISPISPNSSNTRSENTSPKSYLNENEFKDSIKSASSPIYKNEPILKYNTYQSTSIRNLCDLPDCNNPRIKNPSWSPIGGCYIKGNYQDDRSTTPYFTAPTPTNYSRINKTSLPSLTSSVFPETYLQIKKELQEKELVNDDENKCLKNFLLNNSMIENNKINEDDKSVYLNQSQNSSVFTITESEIIDKTQFFVKDTSNLWYRPNISREETIKILLNKPPGSFIVRDSDSFKGAFGLAIRVAFVTPEMELRFDGDSNLVRHYLIQSSTKGVKIKGCPNEPTFGSLSALIFQHTIMQLALPCKLVLPQNEELNNFLLTEPEFAKKLEQQKLLENGAACNVLYLITINTESLTGPEAIKKAITYFLNHFNNSFNSSPKLITNKTNLTVLKDDFHSSNTKNNNNETIVYFKASSKGISLTDNTHRNFFRKHFAIKNISYCGLDVENRKYTPINSNNKSCLFGFVSREIKNQSANYCHLFGDLEQPAAAIVSFINKIIIYSNKN